MIVTLPKPMRVRKTARYRYSIIRSPIFRVILAPMAEVGCRFLRVIG